MADRQTDTHTVALGCLSPVVSAGAQGHVDPLHSAVIIQRTDRQSGTHCATQYW